MKNSSNRLSLEVKFSLWITVVFWSSALVAIRIGLHSYSPGSLGLFRYLVASFSLLLLYFKLPKRNKVPLQDLIRIILIGTFGIGLYNIAFNYGEITVSAGVAGFIIGLMPMFTMLFSITVLSESVPIKSWLGVLLSLIGLGLIAIGEYSGIQFNYGVIYILIASILGGYYAVAQKRLFNRYGPLELVILTIWGGTLIMFIYLPNLIHEIPHASWQATTAAVYLGIFPAAIAYATWNYALSKAPASRAAIYLYAMPIVATLLGFLILQEYPSWLSLIGGIITLFGAITINYFYGQKEKKTICPTLNNKKVSNC